MRFNSFASGLFFASLALAKPLVRRQRQPNFGGDTVNNTGSTHLGGCGEHGPENRRCWGAGFDITTDYEVKTPKGRPESDPVTYDLHIQNVTNWKGADGVPKPALLINGEFPGPVIEANWGDWIQVNVHNELDTEGTSMHWHGIQQRNTNLMDGANGATECPVAPGATHTYKFRATQYGTSWYHSHYSTQYGDGVWGTMVIHGPTSENYDIDLGAYPMSDYYHKTGHQLSREALTGLPASDTIAFNGKNVNPYDTTQGEYQVTTLKKGKKHLLRLINTSVENNFFVRLAGHKMKVVATDFVPVNGSIQDTIYMGIGQRYDVIIEADQEEAQYWFYAYGANGFCMSYNRTGWPGSDATSEANGHPYQRAIFKYEGADSSTPKEDTLAPPTRTCADNTGFTPIVSRSIDVVPQAQSALNVGLKTVTNGTQNIFQWTINSSPINVNWEKPMLEYVAENNRSWPAEANVYEVEGADQWVIWHINNANSPVPHPFHLHGHDFLLLKAGSGAWDGSTAGLNTKNPVRRDVAMLPGNGHLVFAYKTDNPGVWLLHCHIAWHVATGLSVQFLERFSDISKVMDLSGIEPTCQKWRENPIQSPLEPWDSGL